MDTPLVAAPRRRRLSGPKARYRGKVRSPFAVTLTPEGHAALAAGMARTGLSRVDYIEHVIRRDNRRRPDVAVTLSPLGQSTKH